MLFLHTCPGYFYGQWENKTWWASRWPHSPSVRERTVSEQLAQAAREQYKSTLIHCDRVSKQLSKRPQILTGVYLLSDCKHLSNFCSIIKSMCFMDSLHQAGSLRVLSEGWRGQSSVVCSCLRSGLLLPSSTCLSRSLFLLPAPPELLRPSNTHKQEKQDRIEHPLVFYAPSHAMHQCLNNDFGHKLKNYCWGSSELQYKFEKVWSVKPKLQSV